MKLGIVIQGPLISYGQGPNNSMNGFDTLETILGNAANLENKGLSYIVSTWTPSNTREQDIFNALGKSKVSIIHIESPQIFDPDHRYKQHYGVLEGAQALIKKNEKITHLLKIRTDMRMPATFWEWAFNQIAAEEKKLYVSELMYRPYYQGDFIYLAERKIFLDFLTTVVNYKGRIIHPSIAFDMGIKHCEARNFGTIYGKAYIGKAKFLLDFIFRAGKVRENWNKFIKEHIGVMPSHIWAEIEWRSRKIGSFLESKSFKFDNFEISQQTKFISNIRTLIREYKIYQTKSRKFKSSN